jgi:hypothetical protein
MCDTLNSYEELKRKSEDGCSMIYYKLDGWGLCWDFSHYYHIKAYPASNTTGS